MQRSHNILISSLSEVENKWRWLHVDRQREVLFLKNWYQICLYLFEYISYCDSKYSHEIPVIVTFFEKEENVSCYAFREVSVQMGKIHLWKSKRFT